MQDKRILERVERTFFGLIAKKGEILDESRIRLFNFEGIFGHLDSPNVCRS